MQTTLRWLALITAACVPCAGLRAASELKEDLARALAQIEEALARGDTVAARTLADRAIVAHPHRSQLWTLRGAAHLAAREWDAAIADCTVALQLDPRTVAALNHRGGAHFAREDVARALADFEAALAIDPRHPVALTYRAQIRRLQGDHFRALEDVQEAIKSDSNNAAAYLERASIRAALGDVTAALEDCSTVLTIGGLREHAQHLRAMLFLRQGEHRRARDDFEELLAGGSGFSTPARIQLAWLLATAPDAALRDGARASRLASEAVARAAAPDASALDALAAARAELGDFTGALAAAHRAVAATPANAKKELAARQARVAGYLAGQPHRLPRL
jgi:tetratricopeptide (TPR) repeat protein